MTLPDDGLSWTPLDDCGPYTTLVGPLFMVTKGLDADEPARFGFRIEERHCNRRLVCHGGMLATFLDVSLARGLLAAVGFFGATPTISMTLEYLAPARLGDWVESRVRVLRIGQQLCFMEALALVSGQPVLRGSGLHKHPRRLPADRTNR